MCTVHSDARLWNDAILFRAAINQSAIFSILFFFYHCSPIPKDVIKSALKCVRTNCQSIQLEDVNIATRKKVRRIQLASFSRHSNQKVQIPFCVSPTTFDSFIEIRNAFYRKLNQTRFNARAKNSRTKSD